MPGCAGYTRHMHSNWTTSHLRRRRSSPRAIIAAKLNDNPFPNVVDVAGWALEANMPETEAFRIVGELLPEAVKVQARFEHLLKPFAL
ncbi:hypothetical protein GSI_04409 [Ganoderma sinense ZZ0214-1]|uniref:Uncharacterized protein n=1 Tax=Ganoderma sinense ZZ0214-1 TaxID=1077348 RepID=A0A2G8SJ34_9APHY|nr:hypothetical protein GSI_04409 [Ganoderma sinense ZZ0214-1]